MELSLKIDLTDAQYKELMEKSFDAVMDMKEVQDAISKTIVESMASYIKEHPYLITDFLGISSNNRYYDSEYEARRNTCKLIIEKSLESYSEEISEATKETMKAFMKTVKFDDIFEHFFLKAMLNGFTSGLENERIITESRLQRLESCTDDLRERLGLT